VTTAEDLDIELGPVDYLVVEFPGSKFNGEIAPALADLVDRKLVRVLDLLMITKTEDGSIDAAEISDLDEAEIGGLRAHEAELAMLLSEEDVSSIAAAMEPGSTAGVLALARPSSWPTATTAATAAASSQRTPRWPAMRRPRSGTRGCRSCCRACSRSARPPGTDCSTSGGTGTSHRA
jgi:Family of unknown function (DUF6325)